MDGNNFYKTDAFEGSFERYEYHFIPMIYFIYYSLNKFNI